jgi:hypothetical protein
MQLMHFIFCTGELVALLSDGTPEGKTAFCFFRICYHYCITNLLLYTVYL